MNEDEVRRLAYEAAMGAERERWHRPPWETREAKVRTPEAVKLQVAWREREAARFSAGEAYWHYRRASRELLDTRDAEARPLLVQEAAAKWQQAKELRMVFDRAAERLANLATEYADLAAAHHRDGSLLRLVAQEATTTDDAKEAGQKLIADAARLVDDIM